MGVILSTGVIQIDMHLEQNFQEFSDLMFTMQ